MLYQAMPIKKPLVVNQVALNRVTSAINRICG